VEDKKATAFEPLPGGEDGGESNPMGPILHVNHRLYLTSPQASNPEPFHLRDPTTHQMSFPHVTTSMIVIIADKSQNQSGDGQKER
jgi:hypothetical protein